MNDKDLNDKQEPSVTDKKLKNSEVSAVTNENQVAVKTQEQTGEEEIFGGYEVKNWDYDTRIYKIIGVATLFNLLGLFVFAQTNLISTSACESPFVSNVCDVLDTVYVGSKLFGGSGKEYVNEIYDKTEINDADVVWVDTTNVQPQIEYPTGYFEIANRDEIAAREALLNPENTFSNGNSITNPPFTPAPYTPPSPTKRKSSIKTPTYRPKRSKRRSGGLLPKQKLAKRKKGGVVKGGEINNDLFGESDPKKGNKDGTKPEKDPVKQKNPIAENSVKDSDSVKEVEINKKPLEDFAEIAVAKWEKKEVDFGKQFRIQLIGKINENGRLDGKKSGFNPNADAGDEKMINLAKTALEAVGDSGWLTYLRNLGAKNVKITLMQNETSLVARVESEMKNESEAKSVASGMNILIATTKQYVKLDEDETKLINAAQAPTSKKNIFTLDFQMPKEDAQKMIQDNLKKALAKKQEKENGKKTPTQPNGTALKKDSNDNSAKK